MANKTLSPDHLAEVNRARIFNSSAMGIPSSYVCWALNQHLGRGIQWRGMSKGELSLIFAGTHSDFGSGMSTWTTTQLNVVLRTAAYLQRQTNLQRRAGS